MFAKVGLSGAANSLLAYGLDVLLWRSARKWIKRDSTQFKLMIVCAVVRQLLQIQRMYVMSLNRFKPVAGRAKLVGGRSGCLLAATWAGGDIRASGLLCKSQR